MGKKTKENKYFISHDWFSQILGLKSGPERDLFAIVYSYNTNTDKNGNIWNFNEGPKETGDRIGASERSIIRASKALEEKGYLINNPKRHNQKWMCCIDFENLKSMFPELEISQEQIDYSAKFRTDKMSVLNKESNTDKMSVLNQSNTDKMSTLNRVRTDKMSVSKCKKEKIKKCTCNKDTHIHFDNFIEQLNLIYPKTDTIRANGSNSKICKNKIYDNLVAIIGEEKIDDVNCLDALIAATKEYINNFQGDLKFFPAFHNLIDKDGKYFSNGFQNIVVDCWNEEMKRQKFKEGYSKEEPEMTDEEWIEMMKASFDGEADGIKSLDYWPLDYKSSSFEGYHEEFECDKKFVDDLKKVYADTIGIKSDQHEKRERYIYYISEVYAPLVFHAAQSVGFLNPIYHDDFINDFKAKISEHMEKVGYCDCEFGYFIADKYGVDLRKIVEEEQENKKRFERVYQ